MDISRLIWKLVPREKRNKLLSYLPELERLGFDRLLKGKTQYPAFFDQYQCIFIHITKCAGSSVSRVLFADSVDHFPMAWYQMQDQQKYASYYKFTLVRNPWDRLISSYHYLRNMMQTTHKRDALWHKELSRFNDFEEFVLQWLTKENIERNILFTPQYRFLEDMHGFINMDFIGKVENIEMDFKIICRQLGLDKTLEKINASEHKAYTRYYSDKTIARVAEIYQRDIELFGYHYS